MRRNAVARLTLAIAVGCLLLVGCNTGDPGDGAGISEYYDGLSEASDRNATKVAKNGGRTEADMQQEERDYNATREAQRDVEFRREMEDAHKDAVRSCILSGVEAALCNLDPSDPYGIGEQR